MKLGSFTRGLAMKAVIAPLALALSACGGGGGGGAPTPVSMGGTAAFGKPFANATITVTCSVGSASTTTDVNGLYNLVAFVQTPCVLTATDGKVSLHSLTSSGGVVNVTPLTELLTVYLAGRLNISESALFSGFPGNAKAQNLFADPAQINTAQAAIVALIANTYHINISTTNFLSTSFVAGSGTGADGDLVVLATTGAIDPTTGLPSSGANGATFSLGQSNPFNPGGATGATGGTGGPATGR